MTKDCEARREFLKTVIVLAGAAVVAPRIAKALPAAHPVKVLPEQSSQGYKETAHISKYYQTARM